MSFFNKLFQSNPIKGEKNETKSSSSILGMILLEELDSLDFDNVISELKNKWGLQAKDIKSDNGTSVFDINGYMIAIAYMPAPVPGNEVEEVVKYNYFWKNGVNEVSKHKGHIILSVMKVRRNPILENFLFSKIASTVMNNSKAIGIYIGARTLVLKKDMYMETVEKMSPEKLPLYIWIYFGLRKENEKQSIYTYGIADFGKMEMEVLDSEHTMSELSEMTYNLAHYVISSDVTLNDGETMGISSTQKIKLSISKGKYLDSDTIKIEY